MVDTVLILALDEILASMAQARFFFKKRDTESDFLDYKSKTALRRKAVLHKRFFYFSSISTDSIFTGSTGVEPSPPGMVGAVAILSTISRPEVTSPKIT